MSVLLQGFPGRSIGPRTAACRWCEARRDRSL